MLGGLPCRSAQAVTRTSAPHACHSSIAECACNVQYYWWDSARAMRDTLLDGSRGIIFLLILKLPI